MFDHVTDWVELALRWIHIVTGAAWIGTSFYFNWLNNNLRPPEEEMEGVGTSSTCCGRRLATRSGAS